MTYVATDPYCATWGSSGPTAFDAFAGGGGTSEGLRQAGIHVELAANHWDVALETHAKNHPNTEHRCANLAETDWRTYPSTFLGWFSPSCKWHTPAGGRKKLSREEELRLRRTDPGAIDRATAFAVIAAAEVHLYPVVIVENVPEYRSWVLYQWWLDGLRQLGYTINELILNAADFGHAQNRKRLFVVATRGVDLDLTRPNIPAVPATAILDPTPLKPVTRRLYVSPQIDQITDEHLYLVTYRNNAKAIRADSNPIAAVTAGGNHHAIAQVIDGKPYHRLLGNRERARSQGFTDDYEFVGDVDEVRCQIGNAVPVGIARWFGECIQAAA